MSAPSAEYMREWRRSPQGQRNSRAHSLAKDLAVKYVRQHLPDVWDNLTALARAEVGLPLTVTPKGRFGKEIEHGTLRGYSMEYSRGLPTCDECREARRIYSAQRRKASS